MKKLLDSFVYLKVRLFFAFLGFLPRVLAHPLCRLIAWLVFQLDGRHRRVGLINLDIAFPEKSLRWKRRTLLRSFQQLGDQAVEISRMTGRSAREIPSRVTYESGRGLENYLQARRDGLGVIFLTAHISAWELLPAAHALHGHPLTFVVRPLDNPPLERWVSRLRSRHGNRVLPKRRALGRALRLIREGRDVGFLIDQNVQKRDGVFVPCLGRSACTTPALAALAYRSGAAVVPGFIYPLEQVGRYSIRFYPPLCFKGDGNQKDLERATAQLNRYIEEMIREFPECWLWGHRRFNTQPDGRSPY